MATIYDVARRANVSIASVSLVFQDPKTRRVGEAKRQRILDVAREVGYVPNLLARGLGRHGTGILGLVVPMRDPRVYFNLTIADVLAGIQKCLVERGYHLLVYAHDSDRGKVTGTEIIQSKATDGVIFINTRICTAGDIAATAGEFQTANIPFVMINSAQELRGVNYVGVDDAAIGKCAGEYLIARGHSRIAMLAGSAKSPTSTLLARGLRRAAAQHGLKFRDEWLAYGDFERETSFRVVQKWMAKKIRPTAVFCGSDLMAPFVYEALEEQGLRIPQDVAVMGRGDLMFAPFLRPALTTFRFPFFDVGYRSASILIDSLKSPGAVPKSELVETPIVERASV